MRPSLDFHFLLDEASRAGFACMHVEIRLPREYPATSLALVSANVDLVVMSKQRRLELKCFAASFANLHFVSLWEWFSRRRENIGPCFLRWRDVFVRLVLGLLISSNVVVLEVIFPLVEAAAVITSHEGLTEPKVRGVDVRRGIVQWVLVLVIVVDRVEWRRRCVWMRSLVRVILMIESGWTSDTQAYSWNINRYVYF